VEVVCWSDLHTAGTKFRIHVLVSDDLDTTVAQGQVYPFADQRLVARIFRVDGHGGITEQCLRTGGGDGNKVITVFSFDTICQRVLEVPEETVVFFRQYFQIGNGGVQFGIPVHQAVATVNQTFVIQTDKNFLNGCRQPRVHCEALTGPVDGTTQTTDLLGNH